MSIFGQLDAAAVRTNPFYVEAGDYTATVTKAEYRTSRDNKRQFFIEYTIDAQESEYLDSKVAKFFDLVDADMTAEKMSLLPAEEVKTIRRNMSALKRTLCGNEMNSSQKGLGVNIEDLNDPDWNPEVLVGTKVNIGISNYGTNNEGVNIKWVNLREE